MRLYERLFTDPAPTGDNFQAVIDPQSLTVRQSYVEPAIIEHEDQVFQFERQGYFCKDPVDHTPERPVFNKTVSLREGF